MTRKSLGHLPPNGPSPTRFILFVVTGWVEWALENGVDHQQWLHWGREESRN